MATAYEPKRQNRTERTNLGVFNSKDARQRNLDSTRAIAGLNQNDQMIALLSQQNEMLAQQIYFLSEQCNMMKHMQDMMSWFAEREATKP